MTAAKANPITLGGIVQRIEDHVENQNAQFEGVDKRLDKIEVNVGALISDKGDKASRSFRFWVPVLLSITILAGGWVWGLARQEAKIIDLENGRFENKGNIAVLMKQIQDGQISDAVRDARYEAILEKLTAIQRQLERSNRSK